MLSVVGVSSIGTVLSDRPAPAAQTHSVITGNVAVAISRACLTFSLRGDGKVICIFFNPAESYLGNKHLLAFHLRSSELGKLR